MYTPKIELLSFATLPEQRKQIVLRALLEMLVVADWNYLLENPRTPALYDAELRYVLKVRPAGLDAWQDIPQTVALGSGDCVAEGSLVKTERGHVPIENVKIGDRVATRAGWKRVENHGCMALNAETLRLRTDTGSVFRATKEHRVFTNNRGFIALGELRERDELVEVSAEGANIQTRVVAIDAAPRADVYDITVADTHEFACYERHGDVSTGIYSSNCKDFACARGDMRVTTKAGFVPIAGVKAGDEVATRFGWRKVAGAILTRANADIVAAELSSGQTLYATPDHLVWTENRKFIPLGEVRPSDRLLGGRFVGDLFDDGDGTKCRELHITSMKSAPKADVYDIAVEGAHEFFCEGVLVHNCWRVAELRNQGYDDVCPHIKVSHHPDPKGIEPPMTVYHIQVRIHDIIEDPSAILGMPTNVTYEQLRGGEAASQVAQQQIAAGMFTQTSGGLYTPSYGYMPGYGYVYSH